MRNLLSYLNFFLLGRNFINLLILNTIFYFCKAILYLAISFSAKFEFLIFLKRWSGILLAFIAGKTFLHTGTVSISIKEKIENLNIVFLDLSIIGYHLFRKIKLEWRSLNWFIFYDLFIWSLIEIKLIFIISTKCKNLLINDSKKDTSFIKKVKLFEDSTINLKILNQSF